jgi:uncharacterized protein
MSMKLVKALCEDCRGLCCRYVALPIDKPKTKNDYDDIRWYLAHEGISVFVEDGDWYINIDNRCRFLTSNNQCAMYERRPKICRGYSMKNCDLRDGEYDYKHHFKTLEEFERYLTKIKKCPASMNGKAKSKTKAIRKKKAG